MSLWRAVAEVFAKGVGLRTPGLPIRFIAIFEGGELCLQLSNGVERHLRAPEVLAAFRLFQEGRAIDQVRIASKSAVYLAAVREEMLRLGVDVEVDDIDLGSAAEAHTLVTEATTRRASLSSDLPASPQDTDAQVLSDERDELVREVAHLRAELDSVAEQLRHEAARASALQQQLNDRPPTPVRIGSSSDGFEYLSQELERYVGGSGGPVTELIASAVKAMKVKPDYAVLECRIATEKIAERWWCSEFEALETPKGSRFSSQLGDLRPTPQDERADIEWATWSFLKGIHSLANLAAHPGNAAERLRVVAALTGVVEIATSLMPAVHREINRRRAGRSTLPPEDWQWD